MKRRIAFALLGMLLIVALGCFDPRGRVTFQAKVIIDDKPIGDVCVYLSPKDGSGPAPISGITDESGTMIMDPGAAKKMVLEFKAGGVSPDAPKAGDKKAKGGPPKGMEMKKAKGGGPKMGDAGAPPAPAKDAKMNGIFLSFKDPNTTPFSVTVPTPGIVEFNLSKSEP